MTPADIDRDVIESRRKLFDFAARALAGERSGIFEAVRVELDAMTCLLEEAPESKRAKIAALVDRYEALLANLTH